MSDTTQSFVAAVTVTTKANAHDVWAIWVDVNGWVNWDQGLKHTDFRGQFRPGTRFTLEPQGGKPVEVTLKTVTQGEEFSDEAVLPFGVIRNYHRLEKIGARLKITHEVQAEIEASAVPFFAKEIWPHMQIGLPVSLNNIVGLVEST